MAELRNPRSDATVRKLISVLPQQPVIDVGVGRELTGRSHVAVQNALSQLEGAGIINRLSERKWGRVWECDQLFELVEELEGRVTTPR